MESPETVAKLNVVSRSATRKGIDATAVANDGPTSHLLAWVVMFGVNVSTKHVVF
jgi:hypothetical protein